MNSNFLNIAQKGTAALIGFAATNPHAPAFDAVHTTLAQVLPTATDVNTVLKTLVGLGIAIVSNFLYKWIDNKFSNKKNK